MATILLGTRNKLEVAAADVLGFLMQSKTLKVIIEPEVVAALAVLAENINTAIADVDNSVKTPWNFSVDEKTLDNLRAVWPALLNFMSSIGVKI